jgi:hypothetical protein
MTAWQLLEPLDEAARAWRAIDEASPHATYFHTPDWAEAFCSAMPGEPDPVAVEFADGNLAVLPMLQHTGSGHRQSMAPYVYGGPLFLRPPGVAHMEEIGAVARWSSDIVLYDNPFSAYPWHQEPAPPRGSAGGSSSWSSRSREVGASACGSAASTGAS